MSVSKLKVLLVMQEVPLESSFLANKFTKLSAVLDVHLLVWDNEKNIRAFAGGKANKIHRGYDEQSSLASLFLNLLYFFLSESQVRNFILTGTGRFIDRLKTVAYYLPVFKIKPDIIHFEFGTLAKDISSLKKLTNSKIIASFRGYDINYVGLNKPNYYDELWGAVDGLHFLGADLKERAKKRGYKGDKPEAIISPAIDTLFFQRGNEKKSTDKLLILSVGRLTWKKGYDYGIRAVKILQEKGIPFEYRIVGDGPHLQALQFTIRELGLDEYVTLGGKMTADKIKQELAQANVFFHPAISEGFCNAVIEAQAMGVPVVCTDADGLRENIADGETGFVVPKWDVDAMAEKLDWFWRNKQEQAVFGMKGIKRANELFRLEKQVNSFVQFYKSINER